MKNRADLIKNSYDKGEKRMSSETVTKLEKNFHFILIGKGGVGKTTVASFITQFIQDYLEEKTLAIDTDQVNASFYGFKSLGVEKLSIMENNEIIARGWDTLIEKLFKSDKKNIVIDNGASGFIPFLAYSLENDLVDLLTDESNDFQGTVYFHCIVSGGEGLGHTLNGMSSMIEQFGDTSAKFIVWLNGYHGKIEDKGLKFYEFDEYKKYKDKISFVLELPEYTSGTFGQDIADMLSKNRTYNDMLQSKSVSIASRNRYKKSQRDLFNILSQLPIF